MIPLGSRLVFGGQAHPIKLNLRSCLVAYGRAWGLLGTFIALLVFLLVETIHADPRPVAAVVLAFVTAVVLAYFWLGRLSAQQRAQRLVYERFFGHAVDVGLIGDLRSDLAASLRREIVARARDTVSSGYRELADPSTQWQSLALDPRTTDTKIVEAAFVLARVEASFAGGVARDELRRTHAELWRRIRAEELDVLRRGEGMVGWKPWFGPVIAVAVVIATASLLGVAVLESLRVSTR